MKMFLSLLLLVFTLGLFVPAAEAGMKTASLSSAGAKTRAHHKARKKHRKSLKAHKKHASKAKRAAKV